MDPHRLRWSGKPKCSDFWPCSAVPFYKTSRQYLLTCKVSRYTAALTSQPPAFALPCYRSHTASDNVDSVLIESPIAWYHGINPLWWHPVYTSNWNVLTGCRAWIRCHWLAFKCRWSLFMHHQVTYKQCLSGPAFLCKAKRQALQGRPLCSVKVRAAFRMM